MPNRRCNNTIHFGRNTIIQQNQYGIPDDNFNQCYCGLVCNAQIWHIYFPIPPPCKGNISALELAIVTIRYHCKAEKTCFAMVYNTIHLISKTKSRNIWFTKYSKLSAGTFYTIRLLTVLYMSSPRAISGRICGSSFDMLLHRMRKFASDTLTLIIKFNACAQHKMLRFLPTLSKSIQSVKKTSPM